MTTEAELYQRMKPWIKKIGYPVRLENAVHSGLPDMFLITQGHVLFMELKVAKSNILRFQKWQYSVGHEMMKHIHPHAHLIIVDTLELTKVITFKEAVRGGMQAVGDVLHVDVRGLVPYAYFTDEASFVKVMKRIIGEMSYA